VSSTSPSTTGSALHHPGEVLGGGAHLRRARQAREGAFARARDAVVHERGALAPLLGDREASARIVDDLSDARLLQVSAADRRPIATLVRSIHAMLFDSLEHANTELRRAFSRPPRGRCRGADAYLLAEALGSCTRAHGTKHRSADARRRAAEAGARSGVVSFYWFESAAATAKQLKDEGVARRLRTRWNSSS